MCALANNIYNNIIMGRTSTPSRSSSAARTPSCSSSKTVLHTSSPAIQGPGMLGTIVVGNMLSNHLFEKNSHTCVPNGDLTTETPEVSSKYSNDFHCKIMQTNMAKCIKENSYDYNQCKFDIDDMISKCKL